MYVSESGPIFDNLSLAFATINSHLKLPQIPKKVPSHKWEILSQILPWILRSLGVQAPSPSHKTSTFPQVQFNRAMGIVWFILAEQSYFLRSLLFWPCIYLKKKKTKLLRGGFFLSTRILYMHKGDYERSAQIFSSLTKIIRFLFL